VQAVGRTLAAWDRADDLVLVDQRRYAAVRGATSVRGGAMHGWFEIDGTHLDLDEISGYYVRPYPPVEQEAGWVAPNQVAALDALLLALAEHAPSHIAVVNRPSAMAGNDSKPSQTATIAAGWFAVPPTVVTNDRTVAQSFWDEHADVVYKSTSGVRSIAARLTPAHRARFDRLSTCPTQFQAYVPGVDHRVHVVGDEVFTVRIETRAVDYRYAARESEARTMAAAVLPADVAQRCIDLSRHLGLRLTGIDLRRTPAGEWYCFEVNTSPAFSWFADHTGLPIAEAVTSLLLKGDS
jgi:glutathione synthase/RimK-type ligase-like ATP-grasp enzyme